MPHGKELEEKQLNISNINEKLAKKGEKEILKMKFFLNKKNKKEKTL